jgi:hypothetical protein
MSKKQPGTSTMPAHVLDAARRLYQSGMSDAQVGLALGVNRQTAIRMVKDDGTFNYHSRIADRARAVYDEKACEQLIYAHFNVVAAKAAYQELLTALQLKHNTTTQKSNG